MDAASIIGLLLTVVSLGLAMYTLWQAQTVQEEAERLRNRFLFQERAPDFIGRLAEVARLVNRQIKDASLPEHQLRSELKGCEARLQGFDSKFGMEKNAQRRSKDTQRQIENALQGNSVDKKNLQDVYAELQGLKVATQELLEDRMSEV